ncbi:MAG: hypothetical protein EAZ34_07050 [Polaromonas sp.]|nr:MAG: hypothetical protein EAZ34_07050 [Polaromonas sp.]
MSHADSSVCPRCGAGLRCGAASGGASCWCFSMPRVVAVPPLGNTQPASCLCPACLQQRIDNALTTHRPQRCPP